ncbi:MAG: copper amine oxidase N-terminal domain-containing protein [Clostridiales bacterium]|nr:copper amine oxidase N-terminal domain-containing protein [Clostridiales bacterium]
MKNKTPFLFLCCIGLLAAFITLTFAQPLAAFPSPLPSPIGAEEPAEPVSEEPPEGYIDYAVMTGITLNGQALTTDQPAIIEDNELYVPLRAIFEEIGAAVEWDQGTRSAIVSNGWLTIYMQIDNPGYLISGIDTIDLELEVTPILRNERTLIPAQAMWELFSADIAWDRDTMAVDINIRW